MVDALDRLIDWVDDPRRTALQSHRDRGSKTVTFVGSFVLTKVRTKYVKFKRPVNLVGRHKIDLYFSKQTSRVKSYSHDG